MKKYLLISQGHIIGQCQSCDKIRARLIFQSQFGIAVTNIAMVLTEEEYKQHVDKKQFEYSLLEG